MNKIERLIEICKRVDPSMETIEAAASELSALQAVVDDARTILREVRDNNPAKMRLQVSLDNLNHIRQS